MKAPAWIRLAAVGAFSILLAGTMAAYAASNTVPSTRMDHESYAITANGLKPSACASLNLTSIISGSGTLNGNSGANLILASAGTDTLNGAGGADCLVAGAGNDTLNGGAAADILLGGDGNDNLAGNNGNDRLYGEGGHDALDGGAGGNDTCDGGSGTDTAVRCETTLGVP
jgi:Ca2+-binding RTX toxin-like protein